MQYQVTVRRNPGEALRKHDALLQAYANCQDVLPMRFGLCVATPDAAQTVLLRQYEPCARSLRELAGHREYAIRVHRTKTAVQQAPISDRTSLAGHEGTERQHKAIGHFLMRTPVAMENFGALTALLKVPTTNPRLAGWACLIQFERIAAALERVADLDDAANALALTITVAGQHAPFSSVTLQNGQEGTAT